MADEWKPGDHVAWDTSQGTTEGTVVRKLTGLTKIKGFTAKPTPDRPEFLVRSDKTGAEAAHAPDELRKRGAAKKGAAKKAASKKPAAKQSAANRSVAKTSAAKRSVAKTSAARRAR